MLKTINAGLQFCVSAIASVLAKIPAFSFLRVLCARHPVPSVVQIIFFLLPVDSQAKAFEPQSAALHRGYAAQRTAKKGES
jgi:hypothetical protein